MIRRTRMLAGTAVAAILVAGSLAAGTDATTAQWRITPDLDGPLITTGSLGVVSITRTTERKATVSRFTFSASPTEMYEIDALDRDWVTLTTHATPFIQGTDLGALVEVNYQWPITSARNEWTGLDFEYRVTGSGQTVTPEHTGAPTVANTGSTLRVLVWPVDIDLPQGWESFPAIRFSGEAPTIDFALTVTNNSHSDNFILGGADDTWSAFFWNTISGMYYPKYPRMGTATLTVQQVTSSGHLSYWSDSEQLTLPVIFNASASRTSEYEQTDYVISGVPEVQTTTADPMEEDLDESGASGTDGLLDGLVDSDAPDESRSAETATQQMTPGSQSTNDVEADVLPEGSPS